MAKAHDAMFLANRIYSSGDSPPELPPGYGLLDISYDKEDKDFHAVTAVNHESRDILVTFRGTNSLSDVWPEWPQLVLNLPTAKRGDVEQYTEKVLSETGKLNLSDYSLPSQCSAHMLIRRPSNTRE